VQSRSDATTFLFGADEKRPDIAGKEPDGKPEDSTLVFGYPSTTIFFNRPSEFLVGDAPGVRVCSATEYRTSQSSGMSWRSAGRMSAEGSVMRPNVELTGPRRHGSLAVRPKMNQGGCTARLPCRSGSG
jgi:hypothetical protein